jgi:hypothetical protein
MHWAYILELREFVHKTLEVIHYFEVLKFLTNQLPSFAL